jgi:hypothetical protein
MGAPDPIWTGSGRFVVASKASGDFEQEQSEVWDLFVSVYEASIVAIRDGARRNGVIAAASLKRNGKEHCALSRGSRISAGQPFSVMRMRVLPAISLSQSQHVSVSFISSSSRDWVQASGSLQRDRASDG